MEREETTVQLYTALSQLREQERAPIVLHVVTGLTVSETADVLGWPAGTVKVRIHRGLARLRERMHRAGCEMSLATIWQMSAENPPVPVLAHAPALLTSPLTATAHFGGAFYSPAHDVPRPALQGPAWTAAGGGDHDRRIRRAALALALIRRIPNVADVPCRSPG